MLKQESNQNPHNICTWQPVSECKGCSIGDSLKCRFDRGDLLHFLGLFITFGAPAFIGMILGGYGWFILGWIAFMLFFFEFWEIRILCSHCPYYAEKGKSLHCIANYSSLKIWKYNPEPINKSEKIQLILGFVILFGYPFPFLFLSGQFILAIIAACGGIIFFWTLRKYVCSQCVNFSCVLNRVPKDVVDEFLRRNPVMRKAWEEKGWNLSNKN